LPNQILAAWQVPINPSLRMDGYNLDREYEIPRDTDGKIRVTNFEVDIDELSNFLIANKRFKANKVLFIQLTVNMMRSENT
jgi:hypothetical protein